MWMPPRMTRPCCGRFAASASGRSCASGTNDIIRDRPLEEITQDLSRVADAALEVALSTALRLVSRRFGQPCHDNGTPARCVILAFGKHGGEELKLQAATST